MRISKVTEDCILFDNGNIIEYNHERQCCEDNYADFKQIEDTAYRYDFDENLLFERCEYGFRFGDKKRMFFIPCYSIQNGYYSYDIEIYYCNKNSEAITILETECEQGKYY